MVEQITMNVDETLELDYLVEQIIDDEANITTQPSNVSTSIDYIKKQSAIFNPPDTGTYKIDINSQTIEIEVTDIPDSDLYHKIDEGSGDTLTDSNGSNDSTSTASLVWVEDSSVGHGWYVELDGSSYISGITESFVGWGTDFSVGVELQVSSALSSGETIWSFANGSEVICINADGSNLVGGAFEGSSWVSDPAHTEPSAPYNIDLVLTWDSSTKNVELYLDESASTGSGNVDASSDSGHTLGAQTNGGSDIGGEGVARFAIWDSIVDPSKFTL